MHTSSGVLRGSQYSGTRAREPAARKVHLPRQDIHHGLQDQLLFASLVCVLCLILGNGILLMKYCLAAGVECQSVLLALECTVKEEILWQYQVSATFLYYSNVRLTKKNKKKQSINKWDE